MTGLSYHLSSEQLQGKLYLIIQCEEAQKRPLSLDKLAFFAQKNAEKQALEVMVREEKRCRERFSQQSLPSGDRCRVPSDKAFDVIQALGTTSRLLWKGQKVVVDPFSAVEVVIEGIKTQDRVELKGKWRLGSRIGSLAECECLFAGDPVWVILNRIIYSVKGDFPRKWIEWIYPTSSPLTGERMIQFLTDLKGEENVITWIESEKNPDPLPFLQLQDRHGAFATLWFDYGLYGKIAAQETKQPFWRNTACEKSWEKDLLETDFIKKMTGSSHYYCPMDKVSKSLTFLLEIGWKLIDHRGKEVIRQHHVEISTEAADCHLLVRGKAHYHDHCVDLKDVVGAFNRRERFIDLSPTTVGLLDLENGEPWEGLTEHEVISGALAVRKQRVGLLDTLLSQDGRAKTPTSLPLGWTIPHEDVGEGFQGKLFPYQHNGFLWLQFVYEGRCGGLLADEMGLGKTVQVVAFFSQLKLVKPCLIVVPTSLLFNWKREFERFMPSCPVYVHEGKHRAKDLQTLDQAHVILTSFALLRLDAGLFKEIEYQVVVLDEAQNIKNPDSQLARLVFELSSSMRLAVTGTPIENRLQDLWSLFHFLLPHLLGERQEFQAKMNAASADKRYLNQVKRKIRPFILRRKKEDVALQLPDKMEQVIWVDMTEEQRSLYDHWLHHTKAGLIKKISLEGAQAHRMEVLEAILRLRQLCAHPWLNSSHEGEFFSLSGKCERLFLDLTEVVEEGKKVLIYSQFTSMLHLLQKEIVARGWKHVYLDGSTKDRESVVRQFQEDPSVSIFLISLKAGGVGLNLTAADYVFLYDPWWNEAVEQQAIDRAHRLGRQGTVIARRYVTALSIEEKMMQLKEHKRQLAQGLFEEGGELSSFSIDDLVDLIRN